MYARYKQAGKGLQIMFLAQIIVVLGILMAFVPLVGGVLALVAVLGAGVVSLYGLYTTTAAHPKYELALYMVIVGMVLSLVSALAGSTLIGNLADVLKLIVDFLEVYFICAATGELLAHKGDGYQADRAQLIWKLYAICTLVSLAIAIFGWVPLVGTLLSIVGLASAFVALAAVVLLVVFYYAASKSLLS